MLNIETEQSKIVRNSMVTYELAHFIQSCDWIFEMVYEGNTIADIYTSKHSRNHTDAVIFKLDFSITFNTFILVLPLNTFSVRYLLSSNIIIFFHLRFY